MAKRRDYSDFHEFIDKHGKLTENQLLKEYKESGGRGKRQSLQEQYREYVGKEKGQYRGQATRQIQIEVEKAKPNFRIKDSTDYDSELSKHFGKSIKELYGKKAGDKFLKVDFIINSDSYTYSKNNNNNHRNFGFLLKDNGQKTVNFKETIKDTLKQAKKYYDRLAKKYTTKVNEIQDTVNNINNTLKQLRGNKDMPVKEVTEILKGNGFHFKNIERISFDMDFDNEDEE